MGCPNKSLQSYKDLIAAYGEGRALAAWVKNNEQIPTIEGAATLLGIQSPTAVNSSLKIVEALGTDKVQKLYDKFYKNNPEKFYSELVPLAGKEQVQILRDYNSKNTATSLQDMLTGIMSEMSYTVGVNTSTKLKDYYEVFKSDEKEQNAVDPERRKPTEYYSNLTVPGGTNYTENEIATPGITPSIKGHAQFSTDQGIGWFRSDDFVIGGQFKSDTHQSAEPDGSSLEYKENSRTEGGTPTKTRRILELQSDWGQKQRKSAEPDINIQFDMNQVIQDLLDNGDLKIIC